MRRRWLIGLMAVLLAAPAFPATAAGDSAALLDRTITGEHRSKASRLRDKYRHPRETLLFFGLRPEMTVVEIWPGGILGVVEHRAKPGTAFEHMVKTGYMTEAHVIELAGKAWFRLLGKSDINANPLDTTDHPNGVWTLPPVMRGRIDPEKYSAVGESNRMTLKFLKPG